MRRAAFSGLKSRIGNRLRMAGWRFLAGSDLDRARYVHWMTQWYPRWVVDEAHWELLVETLRHARTTSSYYRRRLAGLDLGSLTAESFASIPPLTRSDLVATAQSIQMRSLVPGAPQRATGGTSGMSIRIPLDRETYWWYLAGTWRGLRWWDTDFSERGTILLGPHAGGLRRVALLAKDWVMNWQRLPVDERFSNVAPHVLERIARFRPSFIYGFPSAVHELARSAVAGGRRPPSPKVIVLTGEPVFDFQRRAIEAFFQCPVTVEYGSGELGSMAFQCRDGRLHITVENVYLETVSAGDGGPGGALLATQLRNRRFPLIRYETGDLARIDGEACPCGRGLPVIEVLGRVRDVLIGPDGPTPAGQPVEALLNALPPAFQGHVQVIHPRPASIVLLVERNGTSAASSSLAALAHDVFGRGWHISTAEVRRLERLPSGKLPYFRRRPIRS